MSSNAPVLLEVKGEVGGDDLATTVAHESSGVELAHEGVHNGHTCLAPFPLGDQFRVRSPLHITVRSNAVLVEDCGLMILAVKSEEFSPP